MRKPESVFCPECCREQAHWKKNCIYCGAQLYPEGDYEKYIEWWKSDDETDNSSQHITNDILQPKGHRKHRRLGMEFTEEELLATELYPHDEHGFFKGLLISRIIGKK